MLRILLMIFEKYGLGILNLSLLLFVSYKLANNHLRHIAASIKNNSEKLEKIDTKLDGVVERVATLEGKVE